MLTMSTMTRGPLPSGVYWRRRGFAVLLAITLVFVVARVLSGGSDASDGVAAGQETAQQVAAEPTPTATTSGNPGQGKKKNKAAATPTPLAEPNGPCIDADLVVTPLVPQATADSDVAIVLQLTTRFAQACTWEISPDSVTVKVTSDGQDVWSTLDCPGPLPVQEVVVRRDVPTEVSVVWGEAKRSDDSCSGLTDWALPGTYEVEAAALGGEPAEGTFELESPSPEIIVTTPKPTPDKNKQKNKLNQNKNKQQ